jgi:hypothetical protein
MTFDLFSIRCGCRTTVMLVCQRTAMRKEAKQTADPVTSDLDRSIVEALRRIAQVGDYDACDQFTLDLVVPVLAVMTFERGSERALALLEMTEAAAGQEPNGTSNASEPIS